jgi:excisionase family DNA binding protein
MGSEERVLLRPEEAAAAIGVSRAKVYELIASGEIPSKRVGSRLRISVDLLREWANRHDVTVEEPTKR